MLDPAPELTPEPERFLFTGQALRFCLLPALAVALAGMWAALALHEKWSTAVPRVSGARLQEAVAMLRAADLVPMLAGRLQPLHPDQQVALTEPPAGVRLWRQSPVALALEPGAETFRVPDLTGLSRAQALQELRETGFTLGFERALYTSLPAGIIGQSPRPGDLARGGLVDVLISLGPEAPVYVTPRFAGEQQEPVLEVYGSRLQRIERIRYRPARSEELPGEIVEQDPAPGDPLGLDGLRLVIASGPGIKLYTVLRFEVPAGPAAPEVLVVSAGIEVYRAPAEPGSTVRIPVPVSAEETDVHVLLDGLMAEELLLYALFERSGTR